MARPRAALSEQKVCSGPVVAGSDTHRILLALRAGEMTPEQLATRFPGAYGRIPRLCSIGLVERNEAKGNVGLTEAGRRLVAPGSPLSRSKTEIVYCQL